MPRRCGRRRREGQHEGEPLDVPRLAFERKHIEERDAGVEQALTELEALLARFGHRLERATPGRCLVDAAAAALRFDLDGKGQERTKMGRELLDLVGSEPLLHRGLGHEMHGRADGHVARLLLLDFVGPVGLAAPADRRPTFGRTGEHRDLLADDETAEKADTELTDVVLAALVEILTLRGSTDGREETMHFLFGEADAVVLDGQLGSVAARDGDADGPLRRIGLLMGSSADCVGRVLQQLAHVHRRARVEVIRQEVDDPTQVNLKSVLGHEGLERVRVEMKKGRAEARPFQ